MTVYIVITNDDCEVNGEVEGVFSTYEKARECFEAIKADWQHWVHGGNYIDTEEDDYYCVTNEDVGEFCEVKLEAHDIK